MSSNFVPIPDVLVIRLVLVVGGWYLVLGGWWLVVGWLVGWLAGWLVSGVVCC